MSDGPHRSLAMPRSWKKLAERADKCAFDSEQVAEAMPEALQSNWKQEIPISLLSNLQEALGDKKQGVLFHESPAAQLEMLKHDVADKPLAQLLIKYTQQVSNEAHSHNALQEAAGLALQDLAVRYIRSVEEHYLRESTPKRALNVRVRLEQACSKQSWSDIANRLLQSGPRKMFRASSKKQGLDEGVKLP